MMNSDNQSKQQLWRGYIAAAKAHPDGVGSYCEGKGISVSAYYYWKKKLSQDRVRANSPVVPSFIPVEVMRDFGNSELPDPKWLAELIMHLSGGAR